MTGYLAHEVDYAIVAIDVDALPESSLGVAPLALALRLRVWNEVNGADAVLVESSLPLEPDDHVGRRVGDAAPRNVTSSA